MIKIYKTNESNMIERVDEVIDNCWIDLVSPTKEEIEVVSLKTGIDKDLILKNEYFSLSWMAWPHSWQATATLAIEDSL